MEENIQKNSENEVSLDGVNELQDAVGESHNIEVSKPKEISEEQKSELIDDNNGLTETIDFVSEVPSEDVYQQEEVIIQEESSFEHDELNEEMEKIHSELLEIETVEEQISDVHSAHVEIETSEISIIPDDIESLTIAELIEKAELLVQTGDYLGIKDAFVAVRKKAEEMLMRYKAEKVGSKGKATRNKEEEEVTEISSEEADYIQTKENFERVLGGYSALRKNYIAQQEEEKLKNLAAKNEILEELKKLIDSEETLQRTWEDFKNLQAKWKEIGQVPIKENQELWNNFNFLVDKFLDKIKINRELRDLDFRKNIDNKIEICEKLEELLLEDSITAMMKKLRELQTKWREIGPVAYEKREEVNQRFQLAIEKILQKKESYFEEQLGKLTQNLEVKNALLTKLKEINETVISSIKVWNELTEKVEELFQLWKSTGPVPQKESNIIWNLFKAELNQFYNNKKKYFTTLKDEQVENYNKKLLLCKQAETLEGTTDWKRSTEELIRLQNEWKSIGTVPKRYADVIWARFRKSCDTFFNRKQEYFANIGSIEGNNLKLKQELIETMKNYEFGADKSKNLSDIKEFQRKFSEIGRVPIKEKDAIQHNFTQTVNQLLDKLQISRKEKQVMDLRARYENAAKSDDTRNDMKRETFQITSLISKLEGEIQLWENNIGFFAKSKNADIVTSEFKEKIDRAKAELVIQKEKLKLLHQMSK